MDINRSIFYDLVTLLTGEDFKIGDWCYSTNTQNLTAVDAENACTRFRPGGHLAWFMNEQEFQNVKAYTNKQPSVKYWYIGNS